jgi:multiple sugar transport system permease protein
MSRVGDTALFEPGISPVKSPPSKPPKVTAGPGLFGARRRSKSRLVIAIILSLTSLGPLLYMVSLSFQPNGGLLGATVLIPTHPTVQNYVQAWTENSFSRYFVNSLIVAIATVVITVIFASLAAFAFARYQFPLKQTIFYFFLASLAVPNLLLLIPQFLLMDRLHLLDSLTGLVLLYVASNLPFTIFLLRGFFEAIPKEYEESFRLDGARTLGVLTRLIVPLALPAIAVVSMFIFSASWDEFPVALTMIQTSSHYTLPVGLADFIGVHTVAWGPFFAASVIATLPVIVVFLISLRWFRSGVSLGAIR